MNPSSSFGTVLVSQDELAARAAEAPGFLRLPDRRCFAERAMRLRQLASGHAMRDYLLFVADLAEAQQAQLDAFPAVPLPGHDALTQAALLGRPPVPAQLWPRHVAWQDTARALAAQLTASAPAGARDTLQAIASAEGEWLEQQAERLLHGIMQGLDLAAAPVIAAALQVYWAHMALALQAISLAPSHASALGRIDDVTVCPCCGSLPTASLIQPGGEGGGQRYLHCSLCGTEWHLVRIQCSHCLSTRDIEYQSLQLAGGTAPAEDVIGQAVVQAETCPSCHHYLKIVHAERDPMADPVADDLASLTLDLLVSQAGWQRHGVNLMLLFGDDAGTDTPAADTGTDAPSAPAPAGAH